MSGIFSKPKIPNPQVKEEEKVPTASGEEATLASRRAIAARMKKSGRQSTALTDESIGL